MVEGSIGGEFGKDRRLLGEWSIVGIVEVCIV